MKITGYLIDSKQIIDYAKWYLSNPLMNQFFGYQNPNVDSDRDPNTHTYSSSDIKEVHAVISEAKRNPHMVAFGKSMAESLQQGNESILDTGFCRGEFVNNLGIVHYLHYLKKQKILTYSQVVSKAKAINNKIALNNQTITKYNQYCNDMIVKTARNSSSRLQYSRFLGNSPASKQDVNSESLRESQYCNFAINSVYDSDSFVGFKTDESGHVRLNGKPLGAYGTIAYYASVKKYPKPIIKIKNIPKRPEFSADMNYNRLIKVNDPSKEDYQENKVPSNANEVVDYTRFVK